MTRASSRQWFGEARRYADTAFRAQSLLAGGLRQMVALQMAAIEAQSRSVAECMVDALALRDGDRLQGVMDKSGRLGQLQLERSAQVQQDMLAVARQMTASLAGLASPAAADRAAAEAVAGMPHPRPAVC